MSATAVQVRERPILMSAPMVRAILAGAKSVTRRVMKPQPEHRQVYDWLGRRLHDSEYRVWCWKQHVGADNWADITAQLGHACPYGAPGDVLWCREAWCAVGWENLPPSAIPTSTRWPVEYRATEEEMYLDTFRWRPSIHMPRWASRILLEVVSVRVERLQEITDADALAEGLQAAGLLHLGGVNPRPGVTYFANAYRNLWDSLNAARGFGWDANPFVWVVEFRRCP